MLGGPTGRTPDQRMKNRAAKEAANAEIALMKAKKAAEHEAYLQSLREEKLPNIPGPASSRKFSTWEGVQPGASYSNEKYFTPVPEYRGSNGTGQLQPTTGRPRGGRRTKKSHKKSHKKSRRSHRHRSA
jgi:hypothetical protein